MLTRHFPDNPQNQGNRTTVPPPRELHPFRSHPMACFWRSAIVWKAICLDFPPFRHTPPVVFTWPSISPAYAGAGLDRRSSIRLRIFRNSSLGTATSANWNVTYRPWLTTLAPIFRLVAASSSGDTSVTLRKGHLVAADSKRLCQTHLVLGPFPRAPSGLIVARPHQQRSLRDHRHLRAKTTRAKRDSRR